MFVLKLFITSGLGNAWAAKENTSLHWVVSYWVDLYCAFAFGDRPDGYILIRRFLEMNISLTVAKIAKWYKTCRSNLIRSVYPHEQCYT